MSMTHEQETNLKLALNQFELAVTRLSEAEQYAFEQYAGATLDEFINGDLAGDGSAEGAEGVAALEKAIARVDSARDEILDLVDDFLFSAKKKQVKSKVIKKRKPLVKSKKKS